mmetsp:Transcript_107650/g.332527  ORF Transcript_107650/g.332527 Transcript_107650/m.332527 type:complete len:250 (+) Transcript_107650:1031-1780(+)
MSPGATTWTCARSPSYFHSPVKRLPESRSATSAMPLEGFASMGFTGTPREMWQASASAAPSRPSRSAPTRRSKLGISLKAWRTAASSAPIRASSAAAAGGWAARRTSAAAGRPPGRAGEVSEKASARAWRTVGVWMPTRSLACSIRTMYLASSPREAASSFSMRSFFARCESLPEAFATAFISEKTLSMLSLGGIMSTFWETRLWSATSPRSLASPEASALLMWESDLPNTSEMVFTMSPSPTPSSTPS